MRVSLAAAIAACISINSANAEIYLIREGGRKIIDTDGMMSYTNHGRQRLDQTDINRYKREGDFENTTQFSSLKEAFEAANFDYWLKGGWHREGGSGTSSGSYQQGPSTLITPAKPCPSDYPDCGRR